MSYTQEIKIKLQVENILASESKNFSYTIMLSNDYKNWKSGTFDKNWEGKVSFLIDPNKTVITLTNVLYSVRYNFQGKSYVVASEIIPLMSIMASPIEVKLENTRETIKSDGWFEKDKTVPVFVKEQVVTRQCQHIDGAILIAEYIVNEIKQNVKSNTASIIRTNINGITNPYASGGEVPTALFLWWQAVKTDAKWDHKPKIRDNTTFKKVAVHRPLVSGTPSASYYHKYKTHDYFFDVWSNIHYGYVGLSVGLDKKTLGWGASKEQSNAGGAKDDPIDDVTSINIGYILYNRFGQNAEGLTAQHVLDELEKATDEQLPESRAKHWCYNSSNPLKIKTP